MRKYLASLVLAGCAFVASTVSAATPDTESPANAGTTVAVQQIQVSTPGFRDEAAMILVGTALIGLAAVVRRAS